MLTDAELLRRYADGKSEEAFATLVSRYVDLVYSSALRQVGGDAHRAQDVTQIVFTTLARKARSLTHHPVLAGWLYTATQHAAAKAIRTEARRHAREKEAQAMHEIFAPDSTVIDWERVRPVLDDAMRELDDRDREAVLLRFFARRPFREIGTALHLSEDAARMRVERALDKLHGLLSRRGVSSTSSALALALTGQAVAAAPAGVASAVTSAALAGAAAGVTVAGGSAAAAGLFAFMSTGKIAGTVGAAIVMAIAGFGVYQHRQAEAAEASLAAVTRERDTLLGQMRESETRAKQAEARAAALQKTVEAARAGVAAKPSSPTAGGGLDDPLFDPVKAKIAQSNADKQALNKMRESDPNFQQAFVDGHRRGLGFRFGPLYRNLNLSSEQVAQFERRLAESFQDELDFGAAMRTKGVAPNDPAILTLAAQEKARLEADLRAILGEAGLRDYQTYERSYGARETVTSLLGNLVHAGAPLTSPQLNQLTQLVAEHSASYQKGGRVPNRAQDVRWDAVLAQAPEFLSPPQVEALHAMAEQARGIQRVQELTEPMLRKLSPLQTGEMAPAKPQSKG